MFVTVYVDVETFHDLVLERKEFDACLYSETHARISVLVPVDSIYTHTEKDIVTVQNR